MEETLYDEQAIEYYYEEIMETYGDDEEVSEAFDGILTSISQIKKK